MKKTLSSILFSAAVCGTVLAGNPDRQGEAGAPQLLINPWARSTGINALNTGYVSGVEAMHLNVAGISRGPNTEFAFAHTTYLQGADINIIGGGFVKKIGSGAMGISLMSIGLGDIPVTTTNNPEGNGATFSPGIFNIGFGYSHNFGDRISVGVLFRGVSETVQDVNAFALAVDAGVQYHNDRFRFGISLRNIGSRMDYSGQGLSIQRPNPNNTQVPYTLSYFSRSQAYELPSALNLGISYDVVSNAQIRTTLMGNFLSNSFSQDQIGGGAEIALKEMFMLRAGYKADLSQRADGLNNTLETGLSFGASVLVPLKKGSANKIGIDYSYRTTNPFNGIHSIGVRLNL